MRPVKHFLIFGICVAAVVLAAQTALGATRATAAKPADRTSTVQPERQSAMASRTKPMAHTKSSQPQRHTMLGSRPQRHSAKDASSARMRVQVSPLGRMRAAGFSGARVR